MDRLIALVALRWRLDLRALLWARERLWGLLLVLPALGLAALLGLVVFTLGTRALVVTRPEMALPLLSVAATGVGLFWVLSPMLTGLALSEAHDVSRLLHFPVPARTLAAASLVANLAQPAALLKLPVLLGVALGLSPDLVRLPLVLAGVALSFLFMLAAAHATGLILHAASRNRRQHDLLLFLGLAGGFALGAAPLVVFAAGGRAMDVAAGLVTRSDLFVVSPFAWGVRAAVHAGRGEWAAWLVFAALGVAATAAATFASAALIDRIHRGELALGGAPRGEAGPVRMLPGGELAALVEKDLRSAWRDPAMKAALLSSLLTPLLVLFILSRGGDGGSTGAVLFLASIVGLSTFGANAFGLERRGVMLLLSFPTPRLKLLLAKNLCAVLLRLPGLLLLTLAVLLLGSPELLPAALTIALATQLLAAGVDNFMAILFPLGVPPAGGNPHGGNAAGGRGLGASAVGAVLMMGALAASSPFAFLAWLPLLLQSRALWWLTLPLALAGAASVYAMLLAGAARLLARREPDLLQRILEDV